MQWEKSIILYPQAILLNCQPVKYKRYKDWCQGCGEVREGLHPQISVVCLEAWGALLDHIFQHIPAKGIQLVCSKIAFHARQSAICEESLINGDWEISSNSIFLIQTNILMQTHLGSPALLLCPVHYFLHFYSQYYVPSDSFFFVVPGLYFSSELQVQSIQAQITSQLLLTHPWLTATFLLQLLPSS